MYLRRLITFRRVLLALAICALALSMVAAQVSGEEPPILIGNFNAVLLVTAVVYLLTQAVKLYQVINPGWQPPPGTMEKVAAVLTAIFTFAGPVLGALGVATGLDIAGPVGLLLSAATTFVQGLAAFVVAFIAVTGLYEQIRRRLPWLPFFGKAITPA